MENSKCDDCAITSLGPLQASSRYHGAPGWSDRYTVMKILRYSFHVALPL